MYEKNCNVWRPLKCKGYQNALSADSCNIFSTYFLVNLRGFDVYNSYTWNLRIVYCLLLHISSCNFFSYLVFFRLFNFKVFFFFFEHFKKKKIWTFFFFNFKVRYIFMSTLYLYTSTSQNNGYISSWLVMGNPILPFTGSIIPLDAA